MQKEGEGALKSSAGTSNICWKGGADRDKDSERVGQGQRQRGVGGDDGELSREWPKMSGNEKKRDAERGEGRGVGGRQAETCPDAEAYEQPKAQTCRHAGR